MHKREYNEIGISAAVHGFEIQSCLIIESQDFYLKMNYVMKENNKQMFI